MLLKIGVHTAKKLLDSGAARRCLKSEATHFVKRGGTYRSYYIRTTEVKNV